MINTVYTYYDHVDQIFNDTNKTHTQHDLINICQKSWIFNGWNMIILNSDTAKKHPLYSEYHNTVRGFPSINPEGYDYHCYMRWLAMAQVGGGVMIDYDVINYSLSPSNQIIFNPYEDKLTVYQQHVPCVVFGSGEQYLNICKIFMNIHPEEYLDHNQPQKHTSDMIMLSQPLFNTIINKISYVSSYPDISPLIHCAQRNCSENNVNKLQAMTNIYKDIIKKSC